MDGGRHRKENVKMTIVEISGYSRNEGTREFEILDRQEIEKIIDELDSTEIYKKTYTKGYGYYHSGEATCYLDARTGEVKTMWIQSNNFEHPWDSFYKIVLCSLKTGNGQLDFQENDLLDPDSEEYEEFHEQTEFGLEEFIEQKYGTDELMDRIENAIDYYAQDFYFDIENIKKQLDDLYGNELWNVE